jgi:predicted heme/steroid binding protein/uncharacterized membrane protein
MNEFSSTDLGKNDGKDGRPNFVAFEGQVYDVSSSDLWKGGTHMGQHEAGKDLTQAMAGAPHGAEMLERVKEVGVLKEEEQTKVKPPPGWAVKLLRMHPHPITVHFPQALFTFAPIFLVLFYLFKNPHFERTCFYVMIAGWITSIPAFKTGILHWVYKHGKSTKGLYTFKLGMSIVLLIYGAVVIYVHYARGVLAPEPVDVLMLVLYLLLLPMIVSIGHAGGKIVFG